MNFTDFTSLNVYFGRDYVVVKRFFARGKFLEERLNYADFEDFDVLLEYLNSLAYSLASGLSSDNDVFNKKGDK